MNIEDFLKDAENIIQYYHDGGLPWGDNNEFIDTWLKARKYNDDELGFLLFCIDNVKRNEWYGRYYEQGKNYNDLFKIINRILTDLTPSSWYPKFNEVEGQYVRLKEKFLKAEEWAVQSGYLDKDGKWLKRKSRLAAFLLILEKLEIINKPNRILKRNQIDQYFTKRYQLGELLADSFKWSGKGDKYKAEFDRLKFALIEKSRKEE